MEDFACAFHGDPGAAIHDRHVHVHEREAQLNTAGAAHDLHDAGESLERLFEKVEGAAVVPIFGNIDLDDGIDIEPVVFGATHDRSARRDGSLRVNEADAVHEVHRERARRALQVLLEEAVAIFGDAPVPRAQFNQCRDIEENFVEGVGLLERIQVLIHGRGPLWRCARMPQRFCTD